MLNLKSIVDTIKASGPKFASGITKGVAVGKKAGGTFKTKLASFTQDTIVNGDKTETFTKGLTNIFNNTKSGQVAHTLVKGTAKGGRTGGFIGAVKGGANFGASMYRQPVVNFMLRNSIVKHPLMTSMAFGGAMGVAAGILDATEQRMQGYQRNRGMPANNLSTDGLTLSLSRLRHGS